MLAKFFRRGIPVLHMNSSQQTGAPGLGGYSHTRTGRMFPNSPRLKPGAVLRIASLALILASCVPGAASLPQPTQNTNQSTPVPLAALTLAVGNFNYQLTSGGPIEVAYNGGQPITLPENIFTIEEGTFDGYGNINGCATVSPSPPAVVKVDTPISIALDLACYNGLSLGTDKPSLGLLITDTGSKTVYQVALTGWPDQMKMTATAAPTVLPTATIAPTATRDPSLPRMVPSEGMQFTKWGWAKAMVLWGSNYDLFTCPESSNPQFTCVVDGKIDPRNTLHLWDPKSPWTYLGEAGEGTTTIMFPGGQKVKNLSMAVVGTDWYIDSIEGLVEHGGKKVWVPIGYGIDPAGNFKPGRMYLDGGGVDYDPFIKAEVKGLPLPTCGLVGPSADGSFTPVWGGRNKDAGIMWRFLKTVGNNFDPKIPTYDVYGLRITATMKEPANLCK